LSRLSVALIALVALVIGIVIAINIAPPKGSEVQYIKLYPQARALPEFTLTDSDGQVLTNKNLQQQWTLVFVGYTFCPDICPTTLADLSSIYPQLQSIDSQYPIKVAFISVDPARDTTERLAEYIDFFEPDFIAATGQHADLFPLVRAMGMMYSNSQSTDDPNYLVDHSSSVVLINPQGNVIGRFKPDFAPGKVPVSDSKRILHDMSILATE
tara:strand:+ start:37234 stop:37869 length:636 start_codon:yes stop_codon:yes gene_type:complete